jgi:hypothetical protein
MLYAAEAQNLLAKGGSEREREKEEKRNESFFLFLGAMNQRKKHILQRKKTNSLSSLSLSRV